MSTSIQRGIDAFKQQIDAPIASFFNSCVHCGMCAEACLFYEATNDPKYTPINKLEPMRRIWKQEYTFWGQLARTLGISKPVSDADLDEWQELLYDSCTLCGRCSLVCPVGIDLVYMIRKSREGMVASGHAPKGLKEATSRAIKIGGPMGITLSTFKKQVQHAEDECGIKMPFDKQGADYLLLMSSAEIIEFPEFIGAMAKIFKHPQALVESDEIGRGSSIWAFTHILPNAQIGIECNIADHVFIENDVIVGNRVTIKCGVQLWDGLRIEDDVFIGPNATFTNDLFPRSKQHPKVSIIF